MRKMEGRSLPVEGAHQEPELLVSQVSTKKKGKEGKQETLDGGESKQTRVGNVAMEEPQSGRNEQRANKLSEAVLEKYTVEGSKRAHRRGEPPVWRMSRESKNINLDSGMKTVARESFRGSGNTICSERKV